MFTRFDTDFAAHTPVSTRMQATTTLSDTTLVETQHGWRGAGLLQAGMEIATLDGGFKPVAWVKRRSVYDAPFQIPAGALNNCTETHLPGDTLIGQIAPVAFHHACSDYLSLPLAALEGQFGITRSRGDHGVIYEVGMEDEEMIWTNTGLLVHARSTASNFFQTLAPQMSRHFVTGLVTGDFDQLNRASSEDSVRPYSANCWAERELVSAV